MKEKLYFLLVLSLTFSWVGCSRHSPGEFTQTSGSLVAIMSLDPYPPTSMTPALLSLTLTDKDGRPVENAQVSYDLTMPAMTMPPNQPVATSQGQGLYTGQAMFTMPGDWQVQAIVIYRGEKIIFTFDIQVK